MTEIDYLARHRRRVITCLWVGAACLIFAHLVMQYLMYGQGHDHVFGLTRMFDLDEEANLPTWFSSLLILVAAVLLARIAADASRGNGAAHYWWVLAAGFALMSIDEVAMVHELFNDPQRISSASRSSPLLTYTWVVPYALLVAGLGIYFVRFLALLPLATRIRFIVAGGVYVGAALGLEFIEGFVVRLQGHDSIEDSLLTTMQELLEISGVILFIDALLRHLDSRGGPSPAPVRGVAG